MDSEQRRPVRQRAVTLHDVARECGVCAATVSRALKGDTRISADTTARVTAAALRLGYDPSLHEAARRMVLSRHGIEMVNHVVALFFPAHFFETAYFSGVYRGANDVLAARRFAPLLMHGTGAEMPGDYPITLPRIFDRGEVDGVLLIEGGPVTFQRLATHLREATGFGDRPIVSLIWSTPGCSSVVTDDQHGAYQATRHLLELGHRHILHYFSPLSDELYLKRLVGMRAAMADCGLDADRHLHYLDFPNGWHNPATAPLHLTPDGGAWHFPDPTAREALLDYLRAHPEITAIQPPNDGAALHIWYTLRWGGLRVPEDYSLVGFDDSDPIPDANGANMLTTVRLPLQEVGRQATDLLLRQLHGETTENAHLVLPTELVVRGSTAAPRKP